MPDGRLTDPLLDALDLDIAIDQDVDHTARAVQMAGAHSDEGVLVASEHVLDLIGQGEHPVRAVRQYRLLTQKELGERSGIRANHISAIERGMPYGLKTAKRLSSALDVPVSLLT